MKSDFNYLCNLFIILKDDINYKHNNQSKK